MQPTLGVKILPREPQVEGEFLAVTIGVFVGRGVAVGGAVPAPHDLAGQGAHLPGAAQVVHLDGVDLPRGLVGDHAGEQAVAPQVGDQGLAVRAALADQVAALVVVVKGGACALGCCGRGHLAGAQVPVVVVVGGQQGAVQLAEFFEVAPVVPGVAVGVVGQQVACGVDGHGHAVDRGDAVGAAVVGDGLAGGDGPGGAGQRRAVAVGV